MIRLNIYFEEEQVDELEVLPGTVSEHVRKAVDDYLKKMRPQSSVSPSVKSSVKEQNER